MASRVRPQTAHEMRSACDFYMLQDVTFEVFPRVDKYGCRKASQKGPTRRRQLLGLDKEKPELPFVSSPPPSCRISLLFLPAKMKLLYDIVRHWCKCLASCSAFYSV